MIEAREFLAPALARGYSFWTGVPCSFLTPFINYVIQSEDLDYVGAASEGEAVGIAAGAHLAGRKTVVICQNSGLGNTVNPLTSLNYPFKIPTLLITTHRGAPDIDDEPQHELMGKITPDLLDTMEIPWEVFPAEASQVEETLARAERSMEATGRPYALLMKKGTVAKFPLEREEPPLYDAPVEVKGGLCRKPSERMKRSDAIAVVRDVFSDHALIATTGKIGRELFSLGHRSNQLYCVGSMGCASAMGLGAALVSEGIGEGGKPVAVLDGDGAALMKMGAFATIGHYAPRGLIHVLLDNEVHESTGAQTTVSSSIDFARIAAACGYREVVRSDDLAALPGLLAELKEKAGPMLIHLKVAVGSIPDLGRPTMTPEEVKREFMTWYAS
jgi:phosphonopyruvate decarboxylase